MNALATVYAFTIMPALAPMEFALIRTPTLSVNSVVWVNNVPAIRVQEFPA